MEIRSFLAFDLPDDIMDQVTLFSKEIKRSPLNVKWVNVKNIHLTVVFMGNIKANNIPEIEENIEKVCSRYSKFDLSLRGPGVFPNIRRPRVIWLGLEGDLERMSFFRDALQKQLQPFGIKQEKRKFKPHLTLGRFRKTKNNINNSLLEDILIHNKDLSSPVVVLNRLFFIKSELKPSGAEYTKLNSWSLSGKK